MKEGIRVFGRRRPVRLSATRRAGVILATAGTVIAAAAYGGTPPSAAAGSSLDARGPVALQSTPVQEEVAYSECMRRHGVPKFPDPSNGVIPKVNLQQLGVSSAQFDAAQRVCRPLLGSDNNSSLITECLSTGVCTQAMRQQLLNGMRRFARCMRSLGVRNFPDPTVNSQGSPGINLAAVPGTNWSSPEIDHKLQVCQSRMPGVRVGLERP